MFVSRVAVTLILTAALALAPEVAALADEGVAAESASATVSSATPAATWSVAASNANGPDGRESFAYAVDPGTQISDYVAVSNLGKTSQTFALYATDAINEFDTGAFSLLPSSVKPKDAGSWITVSQSTVTLQPGIQARIPFTMLVPSDAGPGDHTAGIVASVTEKSTDKKGKSITLEQRVGARVYLSVSGTPKAAVGVSGLVSGFTPPFNPFGTGRSSLDYAVTNRGNVRVDVTQKITLTGPFGIALGTFSAKRLTNLLPGQSVHTSLDRTGIAPLFLLWSTVTVQTHSPTDRVAESKLRTANGSPAKLPSVSKYTSASGDTLTGAVPWTLLLVLIVVGAGVYLLYRYISFTRERLYDAIDAASLAAREKALAESGSVRDGHTADSRQ